MMRMIFNPSDETADLMAVQLWCSMCSSCVVTALHPHVLGAAAQCVLMVNVVHNVHGQCQKCLF